MISVSSMLDKKGRDVWSVSPDDKVIDALRVMAERNIGALAVVEKGELVGMISERDYARKIILRGVQSNDTPVRSIMATPVYHVHPDTTAERCLALFTQQHIRHLPVIDQGRLVGLISIGDVAKAIASDREATIENIELYLDEKSRE